MLLGLPGHLINDVQAATTTKAVTQGDTLIGADLARNIYDLNGAGITVAVISDSFNCLGGAEIGQANGELPATVTVLKEADCQGEKTLDEGRAMLEVIHDLAPGASLLFHAMGDNPADLTQALNRVADHGAQIIVDDAIYFSEPMFQDGPASQAIDRLVAERGIAVFSSAGNAGLNSYQSVFSDSGTYPLGEKHGVAHDFNPNPRETDTCQTITVGADAFTILSLQWDQPAKSIGGGNGSASDLDVVVYDDPACKRVARTWVIGGSTDNLGGDPVEVVGFDNKGNRHRKTVGLSILKVAGPAPGLLKYILSGSSLPSEHPSIDEYRNAPKTVTSAFGHANAASVFSVGAIEAGHGKKPPAPSYYSSPGGLPVLFDNQGQRLAEPIVRRHVDAVAPTNVNTSFFSKTRPDLEKDGKPNFTGTSAAAPHAAAVAALLLQAEARNGQVLKPIQLYDLLRRSALDMSTPGYDYETGYGLLQPAKAINLLSNDR
ncbi:S8 family serine peptidase [Methylomonas sp. SURF-1]|uniref:S8 family serine peptidase n=1 Tax=Methylomonas aurea TaxID=2952224 RepID=A0ABT1UJX9_9GAMM|nr:S8 family serine peptidase [Methylomonas sp. SURF-1]MCQ8181731.1 S8 family serine peptidase [Methylomonas sp. SURF-1]